MKLNKLIIELQKLQEKGYGDLAVFGTHGASGSVFEAEGVQVTDYQGECGPFDVEGDYINLYLEA